MLWLGRCLTDNFLNGPFDVRELADGSAMTDKKAAHNMIELLAASDFYHANLLLM